MKQEPSRNKSLSKSLRKLLNAVAGLPLVYAGVFVLVASYVFGFSHINVVLFTGLALVVAGVASYIVMAKRESKY